MKMKKMISLCLTCILVIMSLPVSSFAATMNDEHLKVVIINENVIESTIGNMKCIATKDNLEVSYQYFVDGEEIYTFNGDLEIAERLGNEVKRTKEFTPYMDSPAVRSVVVVDPGGGGTPSDSYRFDGVTYISKYNIPYAHPNRDYHFISPYRNWKKEGDQNTHMQLNYSDTQSILAMPSWAIGGGIGAAIGVLIGQSGGAVAGAVIGGVLGAYYGGQMTRLADEEGCLWIVIDRETEIKNVGSSWSPIWVSHYDYIAVGPCAVTDYYHGISMSGN